MTIKLSPNWLKVLKGEFEKDYMKEIKNFLVSEIKSGKTIYPHPKNIFLAFEKTDFSNIKVVILGQDPYYGPNQAQGFCFSVPKGEKLPPSLKNIYKELERSLGIKNGDFGDLTNWTKQGVFLLNSILTVEEGIPASHSKIGWEAFTDEVIKQISDKKENVIFLLWGNFAINKENLIDKNKHFILKATHPSPLGANKKSKQADVKTFIGSDCFKETNEILKKLEKKEIDWKVK